MYPAQMAWLRDSGGQEGSGLIWQKVPDANQEARVEEVMKVRE